jgi:hypothetical protein
MVLTLESRLSLRRAFEQRKKHKNIHTTRIVIIANNLSGSNVNHYNNCYGYSCISVSLSSVKISERQLKLESSEDTTSRFM